MLDAGKVRPPFSDELANRFEAQSCGQVSDAENPPDRASVERVTGLALFVSQ